jgi:hypothetical protein
MTLTKINNVFTIDKGWGKEQWITNTHLYCQKILSMNAGKHMSIHWHKLKTEHFLLISESSVELTVYADPKTDAYILNWDNFYNGLPNLPDSLEKPQTYIMKQWDSFYIPAGLRHTLRNLNKESVIIEASTQHFDDDSYRILRGD